jgi:hypothetical protein
MSDTTITNSGGTVSLKAIEWNETQDSKPAIRDISWSCQFLDTGSWVLSPRKIEVTFRATDSDKEMLEAIFAASANVEIYLYTSTADPIHIYAWHYYNTWLEEIQITYQYRMEEDSDLRWWKIRLTLDVQNFEYIEVS